MSHFDDDIFTTRDLIGFGFLITWDRLDRIEAKLNRIIRLEKQEMSTLSELLSDVAVLEGESGQVLTELTDIEQQLADLKNAGLTPEQQAQVDEIHTRVSAVNAGLAAALPPTP